MKKLLLGLFGALTLVFATVGAASAAPHPVRTAPEAHTGIVKADYYHHHRHWHHRHWEHNHWRYWN